MGAVEISWAALLAAAEASYVGVAETCSTAGPRPVVGVGNESTYSTSMPWGIALGAAAASPKTAENNSAERILGE